MYLEKKSRFGSNLEATEFDLHTRGLGCIIGRIRTRTNEIYDTILLCEPCQIWSAKKPETTPE